MKARDRGFASLGWGLVLTLFGVGALVGVAISAGGALVAALRWAR